MTHNHETGRRWEDDPWERRSKMLKDFIKEVGFPILVSIWLGYTQWQDNKERQKMMVEFFEFKQAIVELRVSIDQQTRTLRRHRADE